MSNDNGHGFSLLVDRNFRPVGMVATLGVLGCAYNGKKALEWMPEEKLGA